MDPNDEPELFLDHVLEYSKKLFDGLKHLVRRRFIRDGDGPNMIRMWRVDLLKFWKKHPNYFLIGHQFLTGN